VRARADAVAALEGRCPRCGAARTRRQEYCAGCALRLPPARGSLAGLRRTWLRSFGWYPGDWIWFALLTLPVAVAGAAVAIVFGSRSASAPATTSVAAAPRPAVTAPALPAAHASAGKKKAKKRAAPATTPAGLTPWPARRNGWTIVLFSYPATTGTTAAYATAARAAHVGLPEVGVVSSARFASLHPGYYVVFSGVYSSAGEADAALRSVRAAGFSSAYTRQISR
jgi:hypothetical protein